MRTAPTTAGLRGLLYALAMVLLAAPAASVQAKIDGLMGAGAGTADSPRTFNFVAAEATLVTGDGNTIYAWGYADAATGITQYPGPTMIVQQGDTVRINLVNKLPLDGQPVSLVFPGQMNVTAACPSPAGACADGLLTKEAGRDGSVSYTFVAGQPGTYLYHSGSNPSLQVEMGLLGALIVRPAGFDPASAATRKAYNQGGTEFDREFLLLLTDMDAALHDRVADQVRNHQPVAVDTSTFYATMWFINGRNAPDTLLAAGVPWLPNQPYNAAPIMHPGDRVLVRELNAGRDLHPFHHHGAHMQPLARDGRVLESAPGAGPDLASPDFTIRSIPGQTTDLIFEWTGKGIGWDIYGTTNGHTCVPDATGFSPTREWCADHGKPFPVILPNQQDVAYGEYYSGSPFLGNFGVLPQGHPGLSENAGYFHIWHSHNEKEITTNNVFPGGMKTFLIIEAPGVAITE
ncbi:multicopper oxidase domain-containing protein [Telluria sp. Tellsp104]